MPETPNHQLAEPTNAALAQTATAHGAEAAVPVTAPLSLRKGDGLGRYTILETLGAGGMGVVYGAYDPDLDRKVALKLLRAQVDGALGSTSNADRARLLREARAMAKLSCPNVITVFEVGTVAERDFVAMEFIDGVTLAEWMKQPRDWRDVVATFRLAGEGLASAHDAGLIHRDFKPANVLIRKDGRVVVTDFGLAKPNTLDGMAAELGVARTSAEVEPVASATRLSDSAREQLTRTGAVLGTPAYMAPEQHRGKPADERTDQYSFSVALYEALYGERPFKGASFDELRAATLAGELPVEPRGSAVPAWLRAVVLRGLHPVAEQRFANIAELLRALAGGANTTRRWLLAAMAVVAIAVALALVLLRGGGASDDFERGKRAANALQCQDAERSFAGVWDVKNKQLLKRALVKASPKAADATYAGFVRVIDRYQQAWARIYQATCAATRVERTRSEEDFHLHMGCLLQRRDQLKSLVRVFLSADAQVADRAVQAAQDLPRVTDCADLVVLRSGLPAAKDPRTRQAVATVRALLAEARALQQALQLKPGIAMASKAVRLAKQSGYQPVAAEAQYRLARLYLLAEEVSKARQVLKEAAFAASVGDHTEYQARVAVAQIELEAKFSSHNATTRKQAELARAMVRRFGRDATLVARLDTALGRLALDDGDYADARQRFDRAYNTLRRTLGPDNLRTVGLLHRLAEVEELTGKPGQALALHQNALALLQKQLGGEHPRVVSAMESVAVLLRTTRRFDEARSLFARTKRYWASPSGQRALAAFGLPQPKRTSARSVRGRVVDSAGKPVAGADVVMSDQLKGDGKFLYAAHPRGYEYQMVAFRTRTDADGRFDFPSADKRAMYVAAETDAGRSWPLLVAKGKTAVTGLTLALRAFGRLEGVVSIAGARPPEISVFATADGVVGEPRAGVAGMVDARNQFVFERVAPGEYVVLVQAGGEAQGRSYAARKVRVEPGKTARLDLALEMRGADVDVTVASGGGDLGTVQIAMFTGHVKAKTLQDVRKAFADAARRAKARVGNTKPVGAMNEQHFLFRGLVAGKYTACAVVLGGDVKNPEFLRSLKDFKGDFVVQCDPLVVGAAPRQHVRLTLRGPTKR